MRLSEGESYWHFRVLEKVGEGGMGVVYRTRDMKLGRGVALKFVNAGQGKGFADRLLREARSLAAHNHPNSVTIHEIGEEKGQPTLVAEWIDDRALDDPVFPHLIPLAEFLRWRFRSRKRSPPLTAPPPLRARAAGSASIGEGRPPTARSPEESPRPSDVLSQTRGYGERPRRGPSVMRGVCGP